MTRARNMPHTRYTVEIERPSHVGGPDHIHIVSLPVSSPLPTFPAFLHLEASKESLYLDSEKAGNIVCYSALDNHRSFTNTGKLETVVGIERGLLYFGAGKRCRLDQIQHVKGTYLFRCYMIAFLLLGVKRMRNGHNKVTGSVLKCLNGSMGRSLGFRQEHASERGRERTRLPTYELPINEQLAKTRNPSHPLDPTFPRSRLHHTGVLQAAAKFPRGLKRVPSAGHGPWPSPT
ncbi:uncharacterized protein B0H64DRAFT_393885 [Chaetomium fimeti]|uniref:Uncharacterized protein n=1 Tax=Chaetomium fimeti TaxID=1854472 RepID=A0AAE0HLZ0_9PEZI|nr:hypothetical protein B0H64DRAFT_393885 [Chaetomium fimeti]